MTYEEEQMRVRLQTLMHREGISQGELANKIGRPQSNLSKILRSERHIPRGFAADIIKAFPNISKDWLMFGEGTMYNDEASTIIPQGETRPRLPKSGTGGHLEDYYQGEKRVLCQEKPIVTQFSDYDFSLIVKNSRMSPKYERGDELFFKRSTIIEWGNDYLVDTSEGPKFKRIFDEGDKIRCVSYNHVEYPDFEIPKDLIYGYYRIVGALRIL